MSCPSSPPVLIHINGKDSGIDPLDGSGDDHDWVITADDHAGLSVPATHYPTIDTWWWKMCRCKPGGQPRDPARDGSQPRDWRVQKEAIHGFIGALHLKGANKGVFITTGGFTAGAGFAAREVRGLNLRLIAGEELTRLMIDHQVGVRHEVQPVPKTDLDFWEE